MSKHTPGPWQSDSKKLVIRRGQGSKMGFAREAREDCYLVETANGGHRHIAFVRNRIDARAIAAAPEMKELLKEFLWADKQFSLEFPECADDLAVFTTGAIQKTEALLKRIEEEGEET